MAKKQGYGQKAVKIMELLNNTKKSDHQIAYATGSHVSYVKALRKKMAHKVEEPQPEIKKMIADWRAEADTDVDAILDERGSRYGRFSEHARITQNIKRAMGDSPNWATIPMDTREALEMVAHKVGRMLNGDPEYVDNVIDIIGYMQLVLDRMNGKAERGVSS